MQRQRTREYVENAETGCWEWQLGTLYNGYAGRCAQRRTESYGSGYVDLCLKGTS